MSARWFARLALPLAGGVALAALPAVPLAAPVHVSALPAASSDWLAHLNLWRASTGLAALTENTTWSAGDYDHSVYMVKNDLVTHYETAGTPYYTVDGDTAARNGNIYVSSTTATTDDQAIDWWMAAPFHELGMMDPRLASTGFGSYREVKSGWDMGATLDTLRGNPFTGGNYPVFFPGNGTTEPLTTYGGNEFPDPLQACSGYSAPTGLPLTIQIGGNVATSAGAVHSLTGNGVALDHCVIDSSNPTVGSNLYYRGAVIVIPRQPLQPGVKYTVTLTVNGAPYTWSFTVGAFNMCAMPTVTSNPNLAASVGTTVTFSASAPGCPHAGPLFQFWMAAPGGGWQVVQPYSTTPTFTWMTAGAAVGTYSWSVWVRDAGSTGLFGNNSGRWDAYSSGTYTLNLHQCASVGLLESPLSPSSAGGTVTLTATAAGCPSPLYQFWIAAPGGNWQVVQPYSANATYAWHTAGAAPGAYSISVWARDASGSGAFSNSSGSWDTFTSGSYTLTTSGCASVNLTESPPTTAAVGQTVTLSASATGCSSPLYQFWIAAPGGSWQIVQPYSSSATYSWATNAAAAGSYSISVWVRDASGTGLFGNNSGRWDAYSSGQYTLVRPCTSVSLAVSPGSTAKIGTPVTLSATASGCANPLYQFWIAPPGGNWQLVRPYSTAATFTWSTSGVPAGGFSMSVWVHDASDSGVNGNNTGRWDAYASSTGSLTS